MRGRATARPTFAARPTLMELFVSHMIPLLNERGYRVIAPDPVGFGKPDKPVKQTDHNYQKHLDLMTAFAREIDLQDATLFAQDWGGLIGLRMVS